MKTTTELNKIEVVIGSWGSYNACNNRSLGSSWLVLNDFEEWEEIEEELTKQGFELEGIDEELFIQDCSGVDGFNCDYMHPKKLFEILKTAGVLDHEYAYSVMLAVIEALGWNTFADAVEEYGENWDDDIYFYENESPEEVLERRISECYDLDLSNLGWLSNYITIDFEQMARDDDTLYEVENGTLEFCR